MAWVPRMAALAAGAVALAGCSSGVEQRGKLVVFTRTLGFRHDSIPAAVAAVRTLAEDAGLSVEATEDPSVFSREGLRGVSAVVFLHTTGEVLDPPGQQALESYLRGGGGFLGIHSAADTGHAWPWYLELVGAEFVRHPAVQPAAVVREDRDHPATLPLPDRWVRSDEWYDFRSSPRGKVRVLLSLDESSYQGGAMGADHPIAWCHEFEGGRAIYTAAGHTVESWSEPLFLEHVRGALCWAAGLAPGRCSP